MSDLLKGLTGGGWALIAGWMLPSGIVIGVFALLVFPSIEHLPVASDIANLGAAERTLVVAFATVAFGVTLHSLQTPLYRWLEGYSWRISWRDRGREAEIERKRDIERKLEAVHADESRPTWEWALLAEKVQLFPADEMQIAPTRLGNAFRSLETYGSDHYGLDSQTFWAELNALVPEALVTDIDRARAAVDFWITTVYVTALLGFISFAVGVGAGSISFSPRLMVLAAVSLLSTRLSYFAGVKSSSWLLGAVRALVNTGRKELAAKMNLELPDSIEDERKMWNAATGFVYYSYDAGFADELDEYRLSTNGDEGSPSTAPKVGRAYAAMGLAIVAALAIRRFLRPRSN